MTRETIEVIKEAIQVMGKTITYKCPVCGVFHKQESPHYPLKVVSLERVYSHKLLQIKQLMHYHYIDKAKTISELVYHYLDKPYRTR